MDDWDIVFATILWNIWVYRNYRLFSPESIYSESILHRSMRMVEEFGHACSLQWKGRFQAPLHGQFITRWKVPPMGWVKVGSSVLPSIFEMMTRPWELRFSFVRHESIAVADAMARLVHPKSLDYRRWWEPPLVVRDVLLADERHVAPMDTTDASCVRFPLQRAYGDPGIHSCVDANMGVLFFGLGMFVKEENGDGKIRRWKEKC
ncbi:hypothetical protein V6N11_052119 [Hibiscus sabdariffa]|uniref:Aminotransferase-like plant mobile domain-containing protein n=1 Tax=Hibiscus sabdariffa TaxID=183260 RepID=A0ABR2U9F6_9ROSI